MAQKKKKNQIIKVEPEDISVVDKTDEGKSLILGGQKLKLPKGGNIVIGTLNLVVNPAKKRAEKHYRPSGKNNWKMHLIIDAILGLFVLGLIFSNIYIFFIEPNFGTVSKINMEIIINPPKIASGERVSLSIPYTNNSNKTLLDATLVMQVPKGFMIENIVPASIFTRHNNTFNLGNIASGASGEVEISGIVFGAVDGTENFSAILNFGKGALGLKNKNISTTLNITDSKIQAKLTAPEKAYSNQPFESIIKWENNTDYEIDELVIKLKYPSNFQLLSSTILASDDKIFTLKNVDAKSKGEFKITGQINSANSEELTNLNLEYSITQNGVSIFQGGDHKQIELSVSKFLLNIKSEFDTVTPGTNATYIISYQNNNKKEIKNLEITARVIGDLAGKNNITVATKDSVLPGQTGEFSFTVPIKTTTNANIPASKNYSLTVLPQASYYSDADNNTKIYFSGNSLNQKVNTDLELRAMARFYTVEGDQLGIGPLPPQVSASTKYWVVMQLGSAFNDVKDIKVSGKLGKNISWTDRKSTTVNSGVVYDSDTEQIFWSVDNLTAPTDDFPAITSAFEIEIIPSADQIGGTANLIENIHITGIDSWTGTILTKNLPNITTNLISDTKEDSGGIIRN